MEFVENAKKDIELLIINVKELKYLIVLEKIHLMIALCAKMMFLLLMDIVIQIRKNVHNIFHIVQDVQEVVMIQPIVMLVNQITFYKIILAKDYKIFVLKVMVF